MRCRKGFTLIEILVVVGIIALLISIIMPAFKKARTQARRTTCASNLHQVGLAMMSYMQESRDRMPYISYMPSLGSAPLTAPCKASAPPDCDVIYLADVLRPHTGVKGTTATAAGVTRKPDLTILQCPDDHPGNVEGRQPRLAPNTGKSFFESERSSYEYRWRLQGLTPQEFDQGVGHRPFWQRSTQAQKHIAPSTIWFSRDYDNFHGKAGTIGARRYVYIDGHVSDYEN